MLQPTAIRQTVVAPALSAAAANFRAKRYGDRFQSRNAQTAPKKGDALARDAGQRTTEAASTWSTAGDRLLAVVRCVTNSRVPCIAVLVLRLHK